MVDPSIGIITSKPCYNGFVVTVMTILSIIQVTPEAVASLTRSQLDNLGVRGMGRQAILRGRCRSSLLNRSRLSSSSVNGTHELAGPSRQGMCKVFEQL